MARPVDPEPLEGPVRFGPYTLVRRIGAGGMGEVFLAREEAVRRACVVKKVLPQLMASPQFAGRFRDEARVVVRLAHPNIARVYAMGEVDEQLYLSMEYVQGKTLSRLAYRLRQLGKTVPLGVLLHLGERLCEGLAYAHEAKDELGNPLHLVHRDLSPANVCISYAGEVKIIDFGAAQSTLKQQETQPRVVIGNLTYMAPEQARKRFVDRRADLYALGVLLWELTAWRPLPQRGDPVERWRRAAYPEWEPAGNYRKGVPQALDALLMRALAPEPAARFPDAVAMGAELARLKAKLTPNCAGDADLARLMESAFPREKVMEETVLRELLAEAPLRKRTSKEVAAIAPPTALAFEHSGIETPEGFVPPARSKTALFGAAEDSEVTVPLGRPRGSAEPEGAASAGAAEDLEATVPAARKPGFPAHAQAGRPGVVADGGPTVPMAAQGLGADGEATVPPGVRHADAETTMPLAAWGAGADAMAAVPPAVRRATSDGEATVPPGMRGAAADGDATRPVDAWRLDADGEATVPPAARVAPVSSETTVPPAAHAAQVSGEVTVPPAARPGAAAGRPAIPADSAATEALEASKVLVAIARSEAGRNTGSRPAPQRTRTADTVTPVMAPRALAARAPSRMVPRETQVGFGLDISQTVNAEAVEARRLELVRAITGDGDAPALSPWRVALHGRRAWAAGLLCACAVGLGVAWALAGR